jgi:hypothetical protein
MSAAAAALVRSFRVGKWTCTMTFPRPQRGAVLCMATEWSPSVPRRLSAAQMREYRSGRDRALVELAGMLGGGNVLVVE